MPFQLIAQLPNGEQKSIFNRDEDDVLSNHDEMAEKLQDAVEKNRAKLVDPEPAPDMLTTSFLRGIQYRAMAQLGFIRVLWTCPGTSAFRPRETRRKRTFDLKPHSLRFARRCG